MRSSVRLRGGLFGALVAAAIALWGAPSAQALFTQCPPVGADAGCQYLITVSAAGTSVAQDTTQGAYETADDSLIGVQNNSPNAISALPLAAPPTPLFGFEQDGLCDPGRAPVPAGCQPVPGTAAGTICTERQNLACSFPPPPGEPANYEEPGSKGALAWPNGDRQNGYEGPTSWFSGVSETDTTKGIVNFSPPIQPGASTYLSLEEPPSASAIQVGAPATTPASGGGKPPALFGKNGIVQGLPSTKGCLSKRRFPIHLRRYPGVTYVSAFVFLNRKSVPVKRSSSGIFSSVIDLRGLPPGKFPVKITVITATGSIITGTRTYKTCHKKVGFHGPGKL